jgi:membrane-associated protein
MHSALDYVRTALDFIRNFDEHLIAFTTTYGAWVYGLLFVIVFAETGLVVTPFLPGDSLLFAAGALCGAGYLNPVIMLVVLIAAAIIGDAVNYTIGRSIGPKVFAATDQTTPLHRMLNREHLDRAHGFFERYGGTAIVLARFVPIVRTFVLWVLCCFGLGYLFGNVPVIKEHFELVALGIVFVSVLPMVWELVKARRGKAGPAL